MSDEYEPDRKIHLFEEGDLWVARDPDEGVASQGATRQEALANLDEALALYRGEIGESIDSPEEERAALEEMGLDPDEVMEAREENELPDFMR